MIEERLFKGYAGNGETIVACCCGVAPQGGADGLERDALPWWGCRGDVRARDVASGRDG